MLVHGGLECRFVSSSDVLLFQLLEQSSVCTLLPCLRQLFQALPQFNCAASKYHYPYTTSLLTLVTDVDMASKALLGFNAAAAIGALALYLNGARVVLDSTSGEAQPAVDIVQMSHAEPPLSSGGKENNYTCTHSEMKPKFLSYDPIMVYIENFITPYETEHLKKLA